MSSCPECGAEMEFSVEEAKVLTGTCGACHHLTTLVQGPLPLGTSTAPGTMPSDEEAAPVASGLECSECGSPLTVEATPDGSIQVTCSDCETVARFVPEERGRPSRPPRDDRAGDDRERGGPPRSRPCRQCGAPLTFTTDENGQLTGECSSCGNRFTLPPRREGDRGPSRGGRGRFGNRPPPRYDRGGRGGWSSGGSGYGRRSGTYRPRGPRNDDEDDSDNRRRRRKSD